MRNPYLRRKMLAEFAGVLANAIHLTLSNRLDLAIEELTRLLQRMQREPAHDCRAPYREHDSNRNQAEYQAARRK